MTMAMLIAGALVFGQADVPDGFDLQVKSLVRQLDDDEVARRIEAEEMLIGLGPKVLDFLPAVTPRTSSEVKDRLGRIRSTLEKAAAESATNASLVTLKGEMSLADALAKMEAQTGNKVAGHENRSGTVKVDFDKTPYWTALDEVLDQAELTINPYGGLARTIAVMARPGESQPRGGNAAYNGIFRFEAVQATAIRDLRNPQVNGMRVAVEVGWEPRTVPISLSIPTDQVEAKDENGEILPGDAVRREIERAGRADMSVADFDIPFQLPDRSSRKIASLKGTMKVMIPGRVETFTFDDLERGRDVQQTRAGVTVTFERLRKNVELYEIRTRLTFDEAANALESHRGWVYNNEAYLLDSKGTKVMPATYETTRQEINEVGMAYLFDLAKGPAGHKFVYKTPAAIIRMLVEFELKGIELP